MHPISTYPVLCLKRFVAQWTNLWSLVLSTSICLAPFSLEAGDFLKPTAKIERDLTGQIRLSIQFKKLTVSDLSTLEIKPSDNSTFSNSLIKFLDICVSADSECGASVLKAKYVQNPLLDKTAVIDQSTTIEAEIDGDSLSFERDLNAETYTFKADILLRSTDPNAPFSGSTKVSTRIVYGSPAVTDNKTDIAVTYSLGVKEAISEPYLVSSKRALTAVWTKKSTVTLSDGSQGDATGVLAILIPVSFINSASTLPSRYYKDDFTKQSNEKESTCSIKLSQTNNTCEVECDNELNNPQFIKNNDLSDLEAEGVRSKSIGNSAGNALTFTDLDPDDSFAIVLQYVPDGTKRTCLVGQASDAITLVQLETGKEPKVGSSNCFIATTAYGSPLHHHLRSLRWFRDQYLLTHSWGRSLVSTYYSYGPAASKWISDKPILKSIVRGILWFPVTLIENSEAYHSATASKQN